MVNSKVNGAVWEWSGNRNAVEPDKQGCWESELWIIVMRLAGMMLIMRRC